MSNWNTLAELDPLWAILSDPKKKFGKWDRGEFLASGDQEAERVLAMCKSNGILPTYGQMLDFGCGAGRMTRAFSKSFSECVGIDVSEKMVELARDFNSDRRHCRFVSSTASTLPFADNSFDFVFSLLVLQHLPKKDMILNYIREFVRVAKKEGVIVFQLPRELALRRRIQGRRRLWAVLSSLGLSQSLLFEKLGLSPIRMSGISRERIEKFIGRNGATVKAVERYEHDEPEYPGCYYFAVKEGCSSSRSERDS